MEMEYKDKVNEYARLSKESDRIKSEIDAIKSYFEKLATDNLADTKMKSISYWGDNAKVVVGNSETVKTVSITMLKKVLGEVYNDFVKEEMTYKLTDPCKRILASAFLGNYTEQVSLNDVVAQIPADASTRKTLIKKLKGKYEQDVKCIMKLTNILEKDAQAWAYFVQEAINWEKLVQVIKASNWEGSPDDAIEVIKSAILVDEGIKVGIEFND